MGQRLVGAVPPRQMLLERESWGGSEAFQKGVAGGEQTVRPEGYAIAPGLLTVASGCSRLSVGDDCRWGGTFWQLFLQNTSSGLAAAVRCACRL